jgi:NitT/TauT family transport system ATP-binding protein
MEGIMNDGIILNNLYVEYKTKKNSFPVICNLSLQIFKGETLAILGPSGCGKSTLINTLSGVIDSHSGNISFSKDKIESKLDCKKHRIGIIPQKSALLPWKTIEANSILPLNIRKEKISSDKKIAINGIYEALGIKDILKKYPTQISGGQAKRASIAQAFIQNPDLLLMDEPFSSLDAINREEAWELFLKIWKKSKPITILVTHSIEEALYLGTRIIVMGVHMGEVKYESDNPFFAKLNPEDISYLNLKKQLHSQLRNDSEVQK